MRVHKTLLMLIMAAVLSACHVETETEDGTVLSISFVPSYYDHLGWAAATAMAFHYYGWGYTQTEIVVYQEYETGFEHASLGDISWLLWDLGDVDSYITGTLSYYELRREINHGNPVLLQYGSDYDGHYLLVHGYDRHGRLHVHDPGYGTRLVHYDDLYHRYFNGHGHHWHASLVIDY